MSAHTVPIDFVRSAITSLERRGIDTGDILRTAGISGTLLAQDRTRVTVDQVATMMHGTWLASDDELFGLGPRRLARGSFKMLALAVIHAPDLRTVLLRSSEFTRILPGFLPMVVTSHGDRTRIEVDTSGLSEPRHLVTDTVLSVLHRFSGWLVGRRIRLYRVELPYPLPGSADDYDLIFGCAPRFEAPLAALEFGSDVLAAPIVRGEDDLREYLRRSPVDLLIRRDYGSTTADQVRTILQRGLRGDWPSSEEIARGLALSLQHVRRLLRAEGTSVRQIKEDILRDAAIASLVRGEEPVRELAERLGFSEPSAFRRAFRRWTGSPPGSYRPSGTED